MPAETEGAPNPQVGNGGANTDNPPVGTPESGNPEPQLTHEQALDALKKTRLEAAEQRKRLAKLDEIEKQEAAKAEAQKSEIDKANQRAQAATEKYAAAATKVIAKDMGFENADLAYKAIRDDLKFDADGEPENAKELLEALLKANPRLKAEQPRSEPPPPSISAAGGNRAQAGTGQQPMTLKDFPRLTDPGMFKN